jgi:hypothetical protein
MMAFTALLLLLLLCLCRAADAAVKDAAAVEANNLLQI